MHKLVNSLHDAKKLIKKRIKHTNLLGVQKDLLSIIYFYDNCTLDKIHNHLPPNQTANLQKLIDQELVIANYCEFTNCTFYNVTDKCLELLVEEANQIDDALNFVSDKSYHIWFAIKTLLHFICTTKKNKRLLLMTLIFSILSAAFLALSIFAMAELPQSLIVLLEDHSQKQINNFIINLSFMGGFFLLQVGFMLLQNIFFVYISQNMGFTIRKELFFKIQLLPFSYLDGKSAGNIMSLFANDVDSIIFTIVQNAATVVNSIFTVIATLICMILINYVLGMIAFALTFFLLIFIFILIKKSQPHFMQQQTKLADINGDVVEAMNVHKMITIFDYQQEMYKNFKKKNASLAKSSYYAQLISGVIYPYNNFIVNFVVSFVALIIIILLFSNFTFLANSSLLGYDPITILFLFVLTIRQFTTPISNFFFTINTFQLAFAATNRINQLLNQENESSDEGKPNLQIKDGEITFNHVNFKYSKFGKNIIKDLTLTLKPNTINAIAGPTGSGKTTIISLLSRFYDINDGSIKIDGVDISHVTRNSIRENISIVLQDSYLFSTTILENIRCARPTASREEVIQAAKLSNAHDFIMRLPNGYDTKINNGIELISEGEKQLIAIARAFLSKAKIIIFDEATSYVDTKTEKDIQNAMMKLMKNKTSIIIAHRLSTIRDADQIAIIKDGILIEKGNHYSLMKQKGFYYKLNSVVDADMDVKNH